MPLIVAKNVVSVMLDDAQYATSATAYAEPFSGVDFIQSAPFAFEASTRLGAIHTWFVRPQGANPPTITFNDGLPPAPSTVFTAPRTDNSA